jgi:hypothetical protein
MLHLRSAELVLLAEPRRSGVSMRGRALGLSGV